MTGSPEHSDDKDKTERYASPATTSRVVVFWDGGSSVRALPLEGSVTFGRALECDVAIDHKSVSRRHAILHVQTGLFLEDLGSANGTRLRGRALSPGERARVEPNDVVELGSTMMVIQGGAQSSPAGRAATQREGRGAPKVESAIDAGPGVIVADPAMAQLYRLVALVARSPTTVLVRGETGSGKDVVATAIHRLSPRASAPFISLNCAAMPEALLESELFGYERGAFTGAERAKPGLLEAARGGTLFLDEVGETTATLQAKLLRAVENQQVLRLGSLTPIPIDVRIIAATNRDLEALVASGGFRADLYFRLNGVSLVVPPLRERTGEIVPLAEHFLALATRADGSNTGRAPVLSSAAKDALERYPWPGNIRELKNAVGQAMIFVDSGPQIEVRHLPEFVRRDLSTSTPPPSTEVPRSGSPPPTDGLRAEVDAFEKDRIVRALEQCSGNQTRAAQLLGISRRTLLSRLDAYKLPRPRK